MTNPEDLQINDHALGRTGLLPVRPSGHKPVRHLVAL
jgi:hypothetical protein